MKQYKTNLKPQISNKSNYTYNNDESLPSICSNTYNANEGMAKKMEIDSTNVSDLKNTLIVSKHKRLLKGGKSFKVRKNSKFALGQSGKVNRKQIVKQSIELLKAGLAKRLAGNKDISENKDKRIFNLPELETKEEIRVSNSNIDLKMRDKIRSFPENIRNIVRTQDLYNRYRVNQQS